MNAESPQTASADSAFRILPSAFPSLTLLREWQRVCAAVDAGRDALLIRKGGIAEGRAGFELKKNFFGLLPTLFHQVKDAQPDAAPPDVIPPEPPTVVSLICQLVDAYVVPSTTDLAPLASFHDYGVDQLAARQQYKAERPLHLLIVRPFRLRQPITIGPGTLAPSCKSWVELPLAGGMGGIEPIVDAAAMERTVEALRSAINGLQDARRIEG